MFTSKTRKWPKPKQFLTSRQVYLVTNRYHMQTFIDNDTLNIRLIPISDQIWWKVRFLRVIGWRGKVVKILWLVSFNIKQKTPDWYSMPKWNQNPYFWQKTENPVFLLYPFSSDSVLFFACGKSVTFEEVNVNDGY